MLTPRNALIDHWQTADLFATVKTHEGEVPRAIAQQSPHIMTDILPAALVFTEGGRLGSRSAPRIYQMSTLIAVRTEAMEVQEAQDDGMALVQQAAQYLLDRPRWKFDGETFEIALEGSGGQALATDLLVATPDYTVVELQCALEWYA